MRIKNTPIFGDANLTNYYPLDGNLNDAKGSNNGTASGSISYVNGLWGQALKFTSGNVSFTRGFTQNDNFTIGAWVYLSTVSTYQDIISITGTAGGYGYQMRISDGTFSAGDKLGWHYPAISQGGSTYAMVANKWLHTVMVMTSGTLKYYVNGVNVYSTSAEGTPQTPNGNAYIGGLSADGIIEEAFFYKAVMSDANILLLSRPPQRVLPVYASL